MKILEALSDSGQPEMSVTGAGRRRRFEAASVVGHGEVNPVRKHLAGNAYLRGPAVPHGVRDEFSDDAQDRVGGRIAQPIAADVEAGGAGVWRSVSDGGFFLLARV